MRQLLLLLAIAATLAASQPARATVDFQKVFFAEYIESRSDEAFAKYAKRKAKCFFCHQGRKSKKNNNLYGQELAKLLDHKKDKKDIEKITAALRKVDKLPFDPKDPQSPTYGDRIRAGKLPAGELSQLKKEPSQPAQAPATTGIVEPNGDSNGDIAP